MPRSDRHAALLFATALVAAAWRLDAHAAPVSGEPEAQKRTGACVDRLASHLCRARRSHCPHSGFSHECAATCGCNATIAPSFNSRQRLSETEAGLDRTALIMTDCTAEEQQRADRVMRLSMPTTTAWQRHCGSHLKRDPFLAPWQDKAAAKELVQKLYPGIKVAATLLVVADAEIITAAALQALSVESFVVKATQGSGMTVVVGPDHTFCVGGHERGDNRGCVSKMQSLGRGATHAQRAAFIKAHCRKWLGTNFGALTGQASYSWIKPQCIFERKMTGGGPRGDETPGDVKIYPALGLARYHKPASQRDWLLFAEDGTPVMKGREQCAEWPAGRKGTAVPAKYFAAARAFSAWFPLARVDFYETAGDELWFQELTFIPNNCKKSRWMAKSVEDLWGYLATNAKGRNTENFSTQCIAAIARATLCTNKTRHDKGSLVPSSSKKRRRKQRSKAAGKP